MNKTFAVVDYNPKVILALGEEKINAIYGDAADKNFLSEIPLDKAKIIISTIPDENSNLTIQERLKELKSEAVFIATSEQPRSAFDLYKEGVDYVIIPHHLGGEYAAHMVSKFKTDKKKYREAGEKHKKELEKGKKSSSFA
jgi:Trk K+ transport system NAD-binding subunit